jgi:spore coat polysaccharide biosynthesis predicted glycosyltransferase SpsG/RimJ/RimL family protein N-acetyltransferase
MDRRRWLRFSPCWQKLAKESGARLLLCDDGNRTGGSHADLILDANPWASPKDYAGPPARLHLGSRFALLRREFLQWRDWRRDVTKARRILVTLGGADAENLTLRVLRRLDCLLSPSIEIAALLGPANPHRRELLGFVAKARHRIALHVNPPDVAAWMAWAHAAVGAGGTTTWERAFMGLPSVTLEIAINQAAVARAADEMGITHNLGPATVLDDQALSGAVQRLVEDEPTRARMAKRGREWVDGEGAERVLMHLTGADFRLRPVRDEDAELLWRWANEPAVRRASFTQRPISWEEHVRWFRRKRKETACLMAIGVNAEDAPLGQVRIDEYKEGDAEIHVSIAQERRGQGWGSRLVRAAVERAGRALRLRRIHAHIKPDNRASLRLFDKAGFRDMGLASHADLWVRHALYEPRSAG